MQDVAKQVAKMFIERADALGYKGKKRDDAALDFFCGACAVNPELAKHLNMWLALVLSVRGFMAVRQLAES